MRLMPWFHRPHALSQTDLSALADGALSGGRLAKVNEHVAGCPICKQDLAAIRQVKETVASLPQVSAPRAFTLTPATASQQTSIARPSPMRYAFAPAAALAALVILIGIGSLSSESKTTSDHAQTTAASAK